MKNLKFAFILAFVIAIASAFVSKPAPHDLVSSGYGKINGTCLLRPLDNGFMCSTTSLGPVCTITQGIITANAYSTGEWCGFGTRAELSKRMASWSLIEHNGISVIIQESSMIIWLMKLYVIPLNSILRS